MARKTHVSIDGESFLINGEPTYASRYWNGHKIEGLLLNSRMVQGIFDDLNPETRSRWAYPDTGEWDPDRNTREFIEAMPLWMEHGLLAITLNLQGGSPTGYALSQRWDNSAFTAEGDLKPDYLGRLEAILDAADDLGMVVILGLFYFGQDQRLKNAAAIKAGIDHAVHWLLERDYGHVLLEIDNECDWPYYDHAILRPPRVGQLIEQARAIRVNGRRLLVGTSFRGGSVPHDSIVAVSDFVLMHGNGIGDPTRIAKMVDETRELPSYRPMPILFNEDDHLSFDQPVNHFTQALSRYASWGYFDYRMDGEGFEDGYQSVPVDWGINSPRKQGFFKLLKEITGR